MKKRFLFFVFLFESSRIFAVDFPCDPNNVCPRFSDPITQSYQAVEGDQCVKTINSGEGASWRQVTTYTDLVNWSCPNPVNPPVVPPSTPAPPWGVSLAAAAAALGMGLLAGVGAIVGAPVLASASAAAAVHAAALAALNIPLGASTPQSIIKAVDTPVKVFLVPDASVPASTPSVTVDPTNGKFKPGGGNLNSGGGTTGTWSQGGATGEWDYTPLPTAENPNPKPTAQIKDEGKTIAQQVEPTSSSTSPKSIIVTRNSDATIDITATSQVPVSTSPGTPTTLPVSTTSRYPSASSPSSVDPIVHVSDTLGNGQPSNAGSGLTFPNTGPGPGTAPTAGSGSGTGGGGCTSGDCATETTQLANKGLLQGIKNALTDKGTASDDPQAKTGSDVGNSLHTSYDGPLAGLKGWQLPAHTSQCPSGTFTIPNSTHVFSFDGHCQFAAQNLPLLSSIFLVLWNLSALWIVIRL